MVKVNSNCPFIFVCIRDTINVKSLVPLLAPLSIFDGDFRGSNPPSAIVNVLGLSPGNQAIYVTKMDQVIL